MWDLNLHIITITVIINVITSIIIIICVCAVYTGEQVYPAKKKSSLNSDEPNISLGLYYPDKTPFNNKAATFPKLHNRKLVGAGHNFCPSTPRQLFNFEDIPIKQQTEQFLNYPVDENTNHPQLRGQLQRSLAI